VNTKPDISSVGNRQVQDIAVRAACWLRPGSPIMDEPVQIEDLANRPPWPDTALEDGANLYYVLPEFDAEERVCQDKLPAPMPAFVSACLRSLDVICGSHQGRYMQLLQRNANSGE
jgi:hypothetical protein